jgi:cytochrome P450
VAGLVLDVMQRGAAAVETARAALASCPKGFVAPGDDLGTAARTLFDTGADVLAVMDGELPVGVLGAEDCLSPADRILLQLFKPKSPDDPYPLYHELRALAPLHRSALGVSFATRFDDCAHILRDPTFVKFPVLGIRSTSMLSANPPEHTRLRGLVSKAFTARTVEALRPGIERRVKSLLDAVDSQTAVDFMTSVGFPLPISVIGELLGVPPEDRAQFHGLVRDSTANLEFGATPDDRARADRARAIIDAYFVELFAERRARPVDDLISALIGARDAGDRLSEDELLSTVVLIFAAGFETTTNLLGNGVAALLAHPHLWPRLRQHPDLVTAFVEETLRYDASIQVQGRQATVDVELSGTAVAAGEAVTTFLGAANRDPARFDQPDRFDVDRPNNQHLSFGRGIHFCIGASLARLEAHLAFRALLERFGRIEAAGPPQRRPGLTFRGFTSLPVVMSAA